MLKIVSLAMCAAALAGEAPGPAFAADVPPNPVVHKGACPFECCTYRDWTAAKRLMLVSAPNSRRTVATVSKGDIVHGLTGQVFATPIRLLASHGYAESPIRAGAVFYALHPEGEGYWSVWYRGRIYSVELDQSENAVAHYIWWVKVRTRSGVTGWTVSDGDFDNQDSCG